VKLRHLDKWNDRREKIASYYSDFLSESSITLPKVASWAGPVWHLYVIRSKNRDKLQAKLKQLGIGTMIHYPLPPHKQGAYKGKVNGDFSIADKLAEEIMSLPIGPQLRVENTLKTARYIQEENSQL
jgi:dTDP-4-amino-4,6-dideoxygalactose transaminase